MMMSPEDIQAGKELLRELREHKQSQMAVVEYPVYDEMYYEAMRTLDSYEFWSKH